MMYLQATFTAFNMQHLKYQYVDWIKGKNRRSERELNSDVLFKMYPIQNSLKRKKLNKSVPQLKHREFSLVSFQQYISLRLNCFISTRAQKFPIALQRAISSGIPPLGQTPGHPNSSCQAWIQVLSLPLCPTSSHACCHSSHPPGSFFYCNPHLSLLANNEWKDIASTNKIDNFSLFKIYGRGNFGSSQLSIQALERGPGAENFATSLQGSQCFFAKSLFGPQGMESFHWWSLLWWYIASGIILVSLWWGLGLILSLIFIYSVTISETWWPVQSWNTGKMSPLPVFHCCCTGGAWSHA